MPDLKELLEPLRERGMPDRWDAIRERRVTPIADPHPSRVSAYVTAAAVALLAVAVIARLSPLGETAPGPAGPTAPPDWLVQKAYELAYSSEDVVPDGAWWTLSDSTTVTPSPDAPTGSPHYLVFLHGDFVADWASVPSGADLPKGPWLAVTYDPETHASLDLALEKQDVDVSGMEPFDLPPASQLFTSDAGWSAAIPPGWHAMTVDKKDETSHQVVIANVDPSSFLYSPDPVPNPTTVGFPAHGVALMVSEGAGTFAGAPAASPPVSLQNDATRSSGADGSMLETVLIQGPDTVVSVAVRVGRDASSLDVRATEDVAASLAFAADSQTTTGGAPIPSDEPALLPTSESVVDGRFVQPVELDDGTLRVDPAPAGTTIPDGAADAKELLWASDLFSGKQSGVVGFGVITLEGGQDGHAAIEQVPGWIAFGWGGVYHCPMITSPAPDVPDLPSNGYVAVAILPTDGFSDFSYEARSSECFEPPHGPTIGMATHVESIRWTQEAPATGQGVEISYTPAPCGSHAIYSAAGDPSGTTLTVSMSVPDAALPCPSPTPVTKTLTGEGFGTGTLRHGELGIVRQANFAT